MTKNELMEMVKEAGVFHCASKFGFHSDAFNTSLEYFSNAILERAAVECEKKNVLYLKASSDQGGDSDFEGAAAGARQCAHGIRALKIDNQAQSSAAHKGEAP